MVLLPLVGALAFGVGLPLGVRALVRWKAEPISDTPATGPAAQAPANPAAAPPVGPGPAPVAGPAEEVLARPGIVPSLETALNAAKLLKNLLPEGVASTLGTIGAGVVASAATGVFVEKVLGQGEGRGNVSTVLGPAVLPVAIGATIGEKAAAALGLGKEAQKDAGHLTAAVVVAPPLALAVGGAKLLMAGVNAISPEVAKAISGALSSLDPTRTDTVTGKAVAVVAGGVNAAANFVTGGLFGKSEEEKAREAAEKLAAQKAAVAAALPSKPIPLPPPNMKPILKQPTVSKGASKYD